MENNLKSKGQRQTKKRAETNQKHKRQTELLRQLEAIVGRNKAPEAAQSHAEEQIHRSKAGRLVFHK